MLLPTVRDRRLRQRQDLPRGRLHRRKCRPRCRQRRTRPPRDVLGLGAAPAILAVVFAGLGIVLALLPGLVAASSACAAAAVAAASLVAFLLSGSLRGVESAFLDFRYGFWPALALAAAAAFLARRRYETFPRIVLGSSTLVATVSVALLALGALVAQASFRDGGEGMADVQLGFPLSATLVAGLRRSEAWDAAALVGIVFLAGVTLLVLARQPSRLAGWTLVSIGAGWVLTAIGDIGYLATSDQFGGVGDGTSLALL